LLYPIEYTILPIVELPIVLYVPTHPECCSCAGFLAEDMVASSTRGFCVWGVLGPFERTLYITDEDASRIVVGCADKEKEEAPEKTKDQTIHINGRI
jgi:hypothetical protein